MERSAARDAIPSDAFIAGTARRDRRCIDPSSLRGKGSHVVLARFAAALFCLH
jgi:hypothetical protein